MQKLALILLLLPSFLFLRAGNQGADYTRFTLGTTKKELTKQLRQNDKTFNLEKHKLNNEAVKKSEHLQFPAKNVTAYLLDGNQLVFHNDRLSKVGVVGEKIATDSLRFEVLDTLKATITKRLGEPRLVLGNSVVWLTDSQLYAIGTRNSKIYITNTKREWVTDKDIAELEKFDLKQLYDASEFDLTLQDISALRNGMQKTEFATVFKKKIKDAERFDLEDFVDHDTNLTTSRFVKYTLGDTKALFMNESLMLVSGMVRPVLTENEMQELIDDISSLHGRPRIIANRYTWRNDEEGLDLIFTAVGHDRFDMIFIIGAPAFVKQ